MIAKLSKVITSFFISKNVVSCDEKEMYEYCFEVFVANICNLLILITIGFCAGKFLETLLFIVVFRLLRAVCGGGHASKHITCILSVTIVFLIFLSSLLISIEILKYLGLALWLIGTIVVLCVAPVDCHNNPFEPNKRKRLRKKVWIVLGIYSLAFILLEIFDITIVFAYTISYIIFVVGILNIVGIIKNKFYKEEI